jgi:hypothetical protein
MTGKLRVLFGIVVAGLMAAPAAAQLAPGWIVNDPAALVRLVQQVQQQANMIQNQMTSLSNEARNLARLPTMNMGNVIGEVQSVAEPVANIPAQIRGIVASNQILKNAPIDAIRTAQINAQAQQADGAKQQAQVQSGYLSQINSTLQQKNAADAAKIQEEFANKTDFAGDLMTLSGNNANSIPNTTRPM